MLMNKFKNIYYQFFRSQFLSTRVETRLMGVKGNVHCLWQITPVYSTGPSPTVSEDVKY
jgi:hypothetical protein